MLDILFFMAIVGFLITSYSRAAIYLVNRKYGFTVLVTHPWVDVMTILSFAYMLGYVITQWVM